MLEKLVRDITVKGLKKRSGAGQPFLSFDTTMQLVDKAGQGEEWLWVRTKTSKRLLLTLLVKGCGLPEHQGSICGSGARVALATSIYV